MTRKNVKFKVTQQDFDDAIVHFLGEGFAKHINNRPNQANSAIQRIFIEDLETKAYEEGNLKEIRAIDVIREATERLNRDGYYTWDKD